MATCAHCDRLFDYVYGLLEGPDLDEMRSHLRSCPVCQAELDKVQAHQNLLATAAKAIPVVPEFALPDDPTTPASPAPASAPQQLPPTVPMMNAPPKRKRSFWRRPALAWTAAAAILIAVGASFSYYRYQSDNLQVALSNARRQSKSDEIAFAALPGKYKALQTKALADLSEAATPYVHMVGPTQLQPNAKAHLHLTTMSADGEPTASQLRIQLVEIQSGNVVQTLHAQSDHAGQARVELDASGAKAGAKLQVIAEAKTAQGNARVQDMMRLQAPTYVTRVDTNKVAYQTNDVIFFRVLVLDRYSLLPPAQPILVRVALKNPQDQTVAMVDLPTGEGGIAAKEFKVAEQFVSGSYTLSVEPLDARQTPVQSTQQRLEVVRDLRSPDIVLDHLRYLPGDTVSGTVRGGGGQPSTDRATIRFPNQPPVEVKIEPELQAMSSPPGIESAKGKNAKKSASPAPPPLSQPRPMSSAARFQVPIPKQVPPGAKFLPFTMELKDGEKRQEFRGVVPLEPTDYDIDLFPEGGDLIAGVENRVYYRVRAKSGEPTLSDGQVILITGKNEIVDSPYKLGLGYFDFTPDTKETYTIRITSPVKTSEVAQPFAKLGVRAGGVVLHVPTAVGKQGDPIRLTLRNQGPARKLLLVAQCRGQVVDQRWFDVKTGSQDFVLQPTPDARGMIKVTAYEIAAQAPDSPGRAGSGTSAAVGLHRENSLAPLAERLVYRAPVQKLELSVDLNTYRFEPGKRILSKLTARTEGGDPAKAWFLASVVDERFLARSRSLAAHFMLLNEIHTGSELEDAQVVLHDSPESAQMLERFLGTHGWRRFIPTGKARGLEPIVFSRENLPIQRLQKQHEDRVAAVLTPLRTLAFLDEAELRDKRIHSMAATQAALANATRFEDSVQVGIRLTLGTILAILLIASLIFMAIAIYRVVKQQKSATPAFGGSFACLLLYLGVWFAGSALGPIVNGPETGPNPAPTLVAQVREELEKNLTVGKPLRHADAAAQVGTYFSQGTTSSEPKLAHGGVRPVVEPGHFAMSEFHEQLTRGTFGRDGNEQPNVSRVGDSKLEFFSSRANTTLVDPKTTKTTDKKDKTPGNAPAIPVQKVDPVHPPVPNQPLPAKKAAEEVEYGYTHTRELYADTLFWNPTLWTADGTAEFRFDVANGLATYRLLLLGHSPSGRFGFYEGRLDVLPAGR